MTKPTQGDAKLIPLSAGANYADLPIRMIEAAERAQIIELEQRGRGRYMSAVDLNLLVRERDRIKKL